MTYETKGLSMSSMFSPLGPRDSSKSPSHLEILFNPLLILENSGDRVSEAALGQPKIRRAFGRLLVAAAAYFAASLVTVALVFMVPFGAGDASVTGVAIRTGIVAIVALLLLVLAVLARKGNRRAFAYARVVACLESMAFLLVALLVPGDPDAITSAKLVVGAIAIVTMITALSPTLRRAFAKGPKRGS